MAVDVGDGSAAPSCRRRDLTFGVCAVVASSSVHDAGLLGTACLASLTATSRYPSVCGPRALAEPVTQPAALHEAPTHRVPVVDDEPEMAALLGDVLESAGETPATETGEVALAPLAQGRFAVIARDLRMSNPDGPGLWRQERAKHPALARRMLFVTGDTLSPAASESLREAGCGHLERPFLRAKVAARVRTLLPDGRPPALRHRNERNISARRMERGGNGARRH
jgi:CheY-like chemotaxis protein